MRRGASAPARAGSRACTSATSPVVSVVSLLSSSRRPMSVLGPAVCLVCALIGAQAPIVSHDLTDVASIARIRAALQKPAPKLVIELPKADFRVNIEVIRPFADIFALPPWVTPPGEFDAPKTSRTAHDGTIVGVGVDPGAVAH